MPTDTVRLLETKKKIEFALDAKHFNRYWTLAKKLFTLKADKISFEEFHVKGSKFFSPETKPLHNQFSFLIMNHCNELNTSTRFRYTSSNSSEKECGITKKRNLPGEETEAVSEEKVSKSPHKRRHRTSICDTSAYCDNALPTPEMSEISIVHGHVVLTALENGLIIVNDDPVKLLLCAVRNHLKAIITATLSRRSTYKLRENRFQYSFGCPLYDNSSSFQDFNHLAENSINGSTSNQRLDIDSPGIISEGSDIPIICTDDYVERPPVSTWDLFKTLQIHKDVIPIHSIYGPAMERIIAKLHHPLQQNTGQKSLHNKEKIRKQHV